ncbi:hypothetical protein Cni_G22428 [Canna indica]|uniref:Uncharacterized protein n=1 Tax=Canna indica TaxID=4628 RepID=A0AAQ3KSM4_9LILI|nr:hypothetical protein Cni_G22428 [Canna indica]
MPCLELLLQHLQNHPSKLPQIHTLLITTGFLPCPLRHLIAIPSLPSSKLSHPLIHPPPLADPRVNLTEKEVSPLALHRLGFWNLSPFRRPRGGIHDRLQTLLFRDLSVPLAPFPNLTLRFGSGSWIGADLPAIEIVVASLNPLEWTLQLLLCGTATLKDATGEMVAAGANFTPHVITVAYGETSS